MVWSVFSARYFFKGGVLREHLNLDLKTKQVSTKARLCLMRRSYWLRHLKRGLIFASAGFISTKTIVANFPKEAIWCRWFVPHIISEM